MSGFYPFSTTTDANADILLSSFLVNNDVDWTKEQFAPDLPAETMAEHLPSAINIAPGLDQIRIFGSSTGQSHHHQQSASLHEFGSAPPTLHLANMDNNAVQAGLYTDPLSQSLPETQFQYSLDSPLTNLPAQISGDDQAWIEQVLMRTDQVGHDLQQPVQSIATSQYPASEIDNHFSDEWLARINRPESVWSYQSVESQFTNNSIDVSLLDSLFIAKDHFENAVTNNFGSALTSSGQQTTMSDTLGIDAAQDEEQKRIISKEKIRMMKPGRTGELTQEQKDHAAQIRKVKACAECHRRKSKCDLGIPCTTCKRYYRNNLTMLLENPCRGDTLQELADIILETSAFPKGPYSRFLSPEFTIQPSTFRITLDLGFGHVPFDFNISLIRDKGTSERINPFLHKHVHYPWPPAIGNSRKVGRQDFVLPIILAGSDEAISAQVESHLGRILLDDRRFVHFPIWLSRLNVASIFYKYFLSLAPHARKPLQQALQILMLIQVGGDVRLCHNDPMVMYIKETYFPGRPHDRIMPCLIRAQLGPIFRRLAHKLMGEVLKQLERLSCLQDPSHFPMIISTFSVLMMALESLQYHFAKVAYHSHNDIPAQESSPPSSTRDISSFASVEILLRFYRSTNCHEQLGTLVNMAEEPVLKSPSRGRSRAGSASSGRMPPNCPAASYYGATDFLRTLGRALRSASSYMEDMENMNPIVPISDMSCFFDRQLARLYRLSDVSSN